MRVFADAAFYDALLSQRDQHREAAMFAAERTSNDRVVTSEPVLVEVLAFMSKSGPAGRLFAAKFVDELIAAERTEIVPQTPELFAAGLDLYRLRPDKSYSLTDCMSMTICRDQRITHVLTRDRHFAQEGFVVLL